MSEDSDGFYRSLFTGGTVVFLGTVLQLGISFVGMALIARVFGRADYGAISIGMAILEFAAAFSVLGLNTGVARYLPRYDDPAERRGVLVSALQMSIPVSLFVGGVLVLFAPTIARVALNDPSISIILRVFGLAIPAVALVRVTVGAVQGTQRPSAKVIIQNLTLPLTRIALIGFVLLAGFSVVGIAFAYLLAYVAAAIVSLYYLYRITPAFNSPPATSMHRPLLVFSLPLILTSAMGTVLSDIDTLLLGTSAASTTADVGIYRAVYPIASLLPFILTAFTFLFLPVLSHLHTESRLDDMHRMYQVVTKWIVFATLPLFFVVSFFPETVIRLSFGPEYLPGSFTLQVLAIGFFFPLLLGPNATVLTTIGDTKQIMYVNIVTAFLNVMLNLWLIPQYSYLGAAVATLVAYAFRNALFSIRVYRQVGIHSVTQSLVVPIGVSLGFGVALHELIQYITAMTSLVLAMVAVVYVVGHGVTVLICGGIEREEVILVLSFEERFGVNLGPLKDIANRLMG